MDHSMDGYVRRLTDEQLAEFLKSCKEKFGNGEDPRVINTVIKEQVRRAGALSPKKTGIR